MHAQSHFSALLAHSCVSLRAKTASPLANPAYAHLLPELENTQTQGGKTIGELIGRNDARAGEEINSFMTTVLPDKEYAVYIEQKNALNLIAGKPVDHESIILHGILPLTDKTATTIVLQVQT